MCKFSSEIILAEKPEKQSVFKNSSARGDFLCI